MSSELEFHGDTIYLLPTVVVAEGQCECCDEVAGWVVSLSFLFFSFSVFIDRKGGGGAHV